MGCGCGSSRRKATPRASGSLQHAAVDPRPHEWWVDFPNGASQPFQTEWQANAASAVGGGSRPRKVYTS